MKARSLLATSGLALVVGLSPLHAACGSDTAGGPELTALETRVEDLAGHGTNTHCTVLPVLLGGRVLEEIDVDGEFRIRVEAARDLVVVSFRELTEPAGLTLAIETEELRTSYAETIAVETQNGRHFSVQLSGGCEP